MLRLLGRLLRALAFGLVGLLVVLMVAANVVSLPASPDRPASALAAPGTRFVEVPADAAGEAVGGAGTISTAVIEAGPADGPAVVLVHGFGGSTYSWRSTLPALAALGYRAVALDLANFGLAEKRLDVDTGHAAQARHVLAVMDALGIEHAVVVGHSMGGSIVTHLALTAPDRVDGLVLVDAAVTPQGTQAAPTAPVVRALVEFGPTRQLLRQAIRRLLDADRFRGILVSAYADPAFVTDEMVAAYGAATQTADWDLALLAVVRDQGSNALPAPLSDVRVPTQVIWGAVDPWIPLARGEALRDGIPGATLVAIPGAGHLPFEEDPDAFMGALAPFLAAHARPSGSPSEESPELIARVEALLRRRVGATFLIFTLIDKVRDRRNGGRRI